MVYVDDMQAGYGRMVMCHMVADTDDELHTMADKIGVARRWHQKSGTPHSHYDICKAKRTLAVQFGAVEIGRRQLAEIIQRKRANQSEKTFCGKCGGAGGWESCGGSTNYFWKDCDQCKPNEREKARGRG